MLVVLPVHQGDSRSLYDMLSWMRQLGELPNHSALIVADAGMDWGDAHVLLDHARKVFGSVRMVTTDQPYKGWPKAANEMFLCAARNVTESFLFMEPDCVPLKAGWLDAIADHYDKLGKPFMGHLMENAQPGFPARYLAGNAVYPANALAIIEPFMFDKAWDIAAAHDVVPLAAHTHLIQNFWGMADGGPTFTMERTAHSADNVFTLANINPLAVLYHRNKDGSLIRLLRATMFPTQPQQIAVVFPVCEGDFPLAMRHAQWLKKMGRKWDRRAVVVYDATFPRVQVRDFQRQLGDVFTRVDELKVPRPPVQGWPHAPNWMFRHTAEHMATGGSPWFWLEADAVVLKPDWIDQLEREYQRGLKPFLGAVVREMGHANGGCIYPVDTVSRIPRALSSTDRAWDFDMKPEMIRDCHDASHLIHHVWTLVNGLPSEVGGGSEPRNITKQWAQAHIKPGAVVIHRIKDQSLLNVLISQ